MRQVKIIKNIFITLLVASCVFFNFPSKDFLHNWPPVQQTQAATFTMQTGYYVGTGASQSITGLGFRPDLVIIKADSNSGFGAIIKSSAMPANTTQYITATANDAITAVTLDSDGFTVSSSASVNGIGSQWIWMAFGGSDCVNSTSTFCVGTYTGNGTTTTGATGFQPDLVVIKDSGARAAVWKSSSMPAGDTAYLTNINNDTSGTFITTLDASTFTVGAGANVNTNTVKYYFFAFKQVAGSMDVGTYTGSGADNRNITSSDDAGLTFKPNLVWVKNSNATTATSPYFNLGESNGDYSQTFDDNFSATNCIQSLSATGGFQVGSAAAVNENTKTIYYAAFGGAADPPSSGTFKMAEGTYTGAVGATVTGLGFRPDLILIKKDGANETYFKTNLMVGANLSTTAFLGSNGADFTNGVTITSDGFSLGTSTNINNTGTLYYYQAFGNAWSPLTYSGATDFAIGVYPANGIDNRNILRFPWQPQLLSVKRANIGALWRTSSMAGDLTDYFNATASTADYIQALNSDGFQSGTGFNTTGSYYRWFAFRTGSNLAVGTYVGNNTIRDITDPGFKPDLVWVKKRTGGTARAGALHPASLAGDNTHFFTAVANFSGGITAFIPTGFSLGTDVSVNEDTFTYDYVAIKIPLTYYQSAYRFFANTDTTDVGAALANQSTGATLSAAGDAFRLRMLMKVSLNKMPASYENFKLQFVDPGSGTCDAPSGGTPATYTDVSNSTIIAFKDNATPADGDALTANANDPTLGTEINQTYEETGTFTNSQAAIPAEQYGKWDFSLYDHGAAVGTTYCFRMVRSDNTVLSGYTVYPTITTAANAVVSISISPGGAISFGNVALNGAVDSTSSPQTITVDSGPANLNIRTSSFTDGTNFWTISNNTGDNQVIWQFQNGSGGWQNFLAVDPTVYTFDTNVAQGASRTLSLRLTMPITTTSYQSYSANVTVTAITP